MWGRLAKQGEEKLNAGTTGFEPARPGASRFQVCLLNHLNTYPHVILKHDKLFQPKNTRLQLLYPIRPSDMEGWKYPGTEKRRRKSTRILDHFIL